MLIFHTSFLKLQYLSVFLVKRDIHKDSTTQNCLYYHMFFKMRTRFTSGMVSHIMKHFFERYFAYYCSHQFPGLSFPLQLIEVKDCSGKGGLWVLLNTFSYSNSWFFSNVVFYINCSFEQQRENRCGNWPVEFGK